MYRIRLEKVEELKAGRKNVYLEKITSYSRQYLSDIFTQKRNIDEKATTKIVELICKDSTKLNEKLNKQGIEKMVKYFFEEI